MKTSGMTNMLYDVLPIFDLEIVEGGSEIGVKVGEARVEDENKVLAKELINFTCQKMLMSHYIKSAKNILSLVLLYFFGI